MPADGWEAQGAIAWHRAYEEGGHYMGRTLYARRYADQGAQETVQPEKALG
jgi:hypothetical protein